MATHPLPEPAGSLYAPYIAELQEFFATSGLRYGSPPDIFAISDRLYTSQAFFEDLASLVRSIILRQGGSMSQAELLRIVAYAIGGPEMELAPQVYRQPLRHLLNFVTGVLRRPWNVPPGTPAEVLAFPEAEAPAAPSNHESETLNPGTDNEDRTTANVSGAADDLAPDLAPDLGSPAPQPEPPLPEPPVPIPPPDHPPSRPTAGPPVPPSNLVTGIAAAVFAILLIAILYHFSARPPQPATAIASRPIDSPDQPAPVASPYVPPTSPNASDPPAPGVPVTLSSDDNASRASSATPAARRSITEEEDGDYTAPPTYHSYISASNSAPPARAAPTAAPQPGSSSQPSSATARNVIVPAPANAFLSPSAPATLPTRGSSAVLADRPAYLDASSGIMSPNLISAPMPDYPALARIAHIHGQVILQAVISARGYVTTARVLSGPRLLRGAAVDAVRRWRYQPYLVQGRPTDIATIVTLTFHDAR